MQTWKPITAGILNIISGIFNLIGFVFIIIAIITISTSSVIINNYIPTDIFPISIGLIITILALVAVLAAIHGVIPIIGGIYALQRRRWLFALISSIVAILGATPLGIASTIFVAIAKDEFG